MAEVIEFVEVGGKKYRVIKTGRAQAEQVLRFTRWLSRYGSSAIKAVELERIASADEMTGVAFLTKFVEVLDTDALIDLFTVLVGCDPEDSEVYFDVAILVDVAIEVYNRQTSIRRLVERFFSPTNSNASTEESSTTSD